MSLLSAVMLGITASIFFAVLAVGMRVAPGDLQCLWRTPARLGRAVLAMMILAPIVTIAVCKALSLHPAVIVALVTLSIAPVGALFSKAMLPLVTEGGEAYARGLFFATTVLSVILTPLALEALNLFFGGDEHINPLAVAQVVTGSVLLPLGVGFVIGRRWPDARRRVPLIQKLSGVLLLVCALVIIVSAWPVMASLVREGTLTAVVIITLIGLAIGHFLGGPDENERTVLAFATVSRHPGVAVALASLTDQPLAPVGVLLAVLVGELAVVPYKTWRKRLRAASLAAGRTPPATGAH